MKVENELGLWPTASRPTLGMGRRTVGRHYSGGHYTSAGAPLGVVANGGPTTTTVDRRRHWSDDRRESVVVDLLTEPTSNALVPDSAGATAAPESLKADAGDAESVAQLPAAGRKTSSGQ